MNYTMINEELRIAECSVLDLTREEIDRILSGWEENATIRQLQAFYNSAEDILIINSDDPNKDAYLEITEEYLQSGLEERKEMRRKAPDSMYEFMRMLEACIHKRKIARRIYQSGCVDIELSQIIVLDAMLKLEKHPAVLSRLAFGYGMICGKRKERAKKRKSLMKSTTKS